MIRSRIMQMAIVGLIGAIVGSFSMMLFASTHFANVAGPGGTPPQVNAAPLVSGASDQDRIVSAVKRVEPSVVALNVVVNGQQYVPVDPFSQLFGGPNITRPQRFRSRVSGSGFVYSRDGGILTNAHVVTGGFAGQPTKIDVLFANGDHVSAHLVSANVGVDLALVKVDNYAKLPPPLALADSDKLQAGQWAIAIGEPLELKQTVTVGVVSGFHRDEVAGGDNGAPQQFKGLLQTSAPINPGNSGGPLVDINGEVIGINQLTANPSAAQGIGFAIPSNSVRAVAQQLAQSRGISQGTHQGYIGVGLQALTDGARAQLGYKSGGGVVVAQVVTGSPADQAGLEPGDVITGVNGKPVNSPEELTAAIKAVPIGGTANLQVWSAGTKKLVAVKTAERPANADVPVQPQQP
ncbi:MAG: trypsin-like peptidase domain-containing protein [Candidatus Eremiobacteraeota bacterium]|nr:trypsin-like peptidase domain-containing protein [Candidatus Eremiobacteraeota bacterium]